MTLRLPGALTPFIQLLGHTWPESDEDGLYAMGRSWMAFSGRVHRPVGDAMGHAHRLLTSGEGAAMDAFGATWRSGEGPAPALKDGATAALVIGTGLVVCAGVVLALKINIIVQLSQLAVQTAQAVAAAPETFGASLATVAASRQRTGALLDVLNTTATRAISS